MTGKRKTIKTFKKFCFHVFILLFGLLMVYPVVWMISGSFKTNFEILNKALVLIPEHFDFHNYTTGWSGFGNITFTSFLKIL